MAVLQKTLRERVGHTMTALRVLEITHYACVLAPCPVTPGAAQHHSIHVITSTTSSLPPRRLTQITSVDLWNGYLCLFSENNRNSRGGDSESHVQLTSITFITPFISYKFSGRNWSDAMMRKFRKTLAVEFDNA